LVYTFCGFLPKSTDIGAYVAAKYAPYRPMAHTMIGGAIGFVMRIIGAVDMWDTPPHWYPKR